MSLTSLARSEIQRVEAPVLRRRSATNLVQGALSVAPKYSHPVANLDRVVSEAVEQAAPATNEQEQASNALELLVKYIPTESATLYLAAATASEALQATIPFFTPTFSYWFFAALTPILFLLILAAKRRAHRLLPFPPVSRWPWWKLAASLIAFLVWGLAVPTNPYVTNALQKAAVAFFAVFVSTGLTVLEGVIEPRTP